MSRIPSFHNRLEPRPMIMATSAEVDSSEGPPKKRQNETFEEKAFRKVSELRETGHDTEDYCCQPNGYA